MPTITKALRTAHPDSPWLWRADWSAGRVKSANGVVAAMAWLFAVTFSGFSVPLVMKASELIESQGIGVALMAALFPAASLGLLYWAVTSTAQWLRFRSTELELETVPGVIGGRFAGTVHVGTVVAPPGGFKARLTCTRRSRSGNKSRESIVWEHELTVQPAHAFRGPAGTAVPISFSIPYESEPTSSDPSKLPSITWSVEVAAELEGADFRGSFEVPIFKTDESSADVTDRFEIGAAEAPHDRAAEGGSPETLDDPRIVVARPATGGVELFLPAGRNRAGAAVLTLFAGLWNGFIYWAGSQVPGLFVLTLAPFAAVGLLLALFVPLAWLQSTTLTATATALTIGYRMLGRGSARRIPRGEIEAIVPATKGRNGSGASWSVRIQLKNRKKARRAASNLVSKADAERIAHLLWRELGQGSGSRP